MKRETFLLIGAISQLILGIFFLFFSEAAASQLKQGPTDAALLFEKNIGIFSIAFALVTFLSRKSPDTIALKAILISTLFYLIGSVCADAYGIIKGIFGPQGWGGIAFRLFFIVGYFYYLARIRIDQPTK